MLIEELRLGEEPAEPLNVRRGRIKAIKKKRDVRLKTTVGAIRNAEEKDRLLLIGELVQLAGQLAAPGSNLHCFKRVSKL